jgi:hypothetical protein
LNSGLHVYKPEAYHLNHTSSHFALVVLEMGVS